MNQINQAARRSPRRSRGVFASGTRAGLLPEEAASAASLENASHTAQQAAWYLRRAIGKHALILALYTAITLVMTWPVGARLTTQIAGSGGDPWQTLWRFSHKESLWQDARNNNQETNFFIEEFLGGGEPQLVNNSVWPYMPLHAAFGQPLAYNIVWLLSFVLSGYAMYLLVSSISYLVFSKKGYEIPNTKYQILQEMPAFLAGIAYAFLPYHVAHSYGHFGAMQLQWIPFIVVLTISFFRRPNTWKAAGLGLLLLIQAWTEHHYFLWLIILAVIGVLFYRKELVAFWVQGSKKQEARSKRTILIPYLLLLISLTIVTLSYLPTIRLALQDNTPLSLGREQLIRFSADLFAPIVPAPFHTLWGSLSNTLFFRYFTGNASEATQYVGIVPLLLIIFFHQKLPGRLTKFWLTVAGTFFLISLGPKLHVFGNVTPIPLPYELVDSWPVISSVRAVARAGSMVGLSLLILFGLVLTTQLKRAASAAAVLAVILLEFLFLPVPTQSAQLHPVYGELKEVPGSRLLEIPAATNYTIASRAIYASNIHGKEVIGNIALERALDQEAFEVARSAPALRQLLYIRTNTLQLNRDEFFGQDMAETFPDVMRWLDAYTILIHTDSLSAPQLAAAREFLVDRVGATEEVRDDILLYDLSHGDKTVHDGVFLMRGEGWENVGYDANRQSTFAEVSQEASGTLVNLNSHPVSITLAFTVPGQSRGQGTILFAGQEAVTIPLGETSVRASIELPPGEHVVTFDTTSAEKIIIQNPRLEVISNR